MMQYRVLGLLAALALAFPIVRPPAATSAHFRNVAAAASSSGAGSLGAIQLDRADSAIALHIERGEQYLRAEKWPEAIAAFRLAMEQSGDRLVPLNERRLVTVRQYCNLRLASMPLAALRVYRDLVDASAKRLFDAAVARRDAALLAKIVDESLASSYADSALDMLGEMAMERGDYTAARWAWERIVPVTAEVTANAWPAVPNTDLDLARVRTKLVLASIFEGSVSRAREELSALVALHPGARGVIGGREQDYAKALSALLDQRDGWAAVRSEAAQPDVAQFEANWPTFAGAATRQRRAAVAPRTADCLWRVALPGPQQFKGRSMISGAERLAYFPVVAGGHAFVNTATEILAFDLATGEPAWAKQSGRAGTSVFQDDLGEAIRSGYEPADSYGVPRYTLTVEGDRLYARMGSAVTGRPTNWQNTSAGKSYLVALDLSAEGRLLWKTPADEPGWAFEGSPVADREYVYVVMRKSDIQPQIHVACFHAETGAPRWRQFICAAESPARGLYHEITHTLLTRAGDSLYCNTNLGAVAALSCNDGKLRWVSLYPRYEHRRAAVGVTGPIRDPNPCLFDRGILYVAPGDSRRLLALEASNGQFLWQSGTEMADVVQLLGVAGDCVIAGGERLYWVGLSGATRGRVVRMWPESEARPGYGRGVLAGRFVYWPTLDRILLFEQNTGRLYGDVPLPVRGLTGGNLVAVGQQLLVATADSLAALGPPRKVAPTPALAANFTNVDNSQEILGD